MPRLPNVIKPTLLHLSLPEDVRTKLDLYLYSELENRVPKGAYQRFFMDRIHEFFGHRKLPLELFGAPQGYFIAGPKEMIDWLEAKLKGEVK